MIAVLDYGIGNLRSAEKALVAVGGDARLVSSPDEVIDPEGVVLPGVGAFGACAKALRASGLDRVALEAIASGVPFLGICVGFQLLFDGSDESPEVPGLGVFSGLVHQMRTREKLPQMGWNTVEEPGTVSAMFPHSSEPRWFYFVHSYAVELSDRRPGDVVVHCDYGGPVIAAIERDDCWGVQFHPEKSGADGLSLLRRFVTRCARASSAVRT